MPMRRRILWAGTTAVIGSGGGMFFEVNHKKDGRGLLI